MYGRSPFRLILALFFAVILSYTFFPLQMTVITVVIVVMYVAWITLYKKDKIETGKTNRRQEALASAKIFLGHYNNIWGGLKLSNEHCCLSLSSDGKSISGIEKNDNTAFLRTFKVLKSNIYEMDEVWNLFCKNFSHNKTYDGLISDCKLYGLVIEEKTSKKAVDNNSVEKVIKAEEIQLKNNIEEGKKVDINKATVEELTNLSGVSVIMAKKAIKRREDIGGFKTVDEFLSYLNIQSTMADKLKSNLTVSECKVVRKQEYFNERNVDL